MINIPNLDLVGQKFGRLTVIERIPRSVTGKNRETKWKCVCDCGKETLATASHLRTGHTKSCGCYSKEAAALRQKKYNTYDLSGEYGIIYPDNSDEIITFDLEDYDKIKDYYWKVDYPKNDGKYKRVVAVKKHGIFIKMHRLIMGVEDEDVFIDHRDRNPLNNKKSNLRVCNNTQNTWNSSPKHNGYKGVQKKKDKWTARIREDGKGRYLGVFDTPEEAALAYNKRAKELFGEFAYINEINTEVSSYG